MATRHEALLKNLLNSPLVSTKTRRREIHLTDLPLYFVRHHRAPIPLLQSMAELFAKTFAPTNSPAEKKWKAERLLDYEQYFARLEILNSLWVREAALRQLVRSHLLRRPAFKKMVRQYRHTEENENLLVTVPLLALQAVRTSPHKHAAALSPMVDSWWGRVRKTLVLPLVQMRHGICHANMRSHLNLRPRVPKPELADAIKRARAIWKKIDAASFYALDDNLKTLHEVVYNWLAEADHVDVVSAAVASIKQILVSRTAIADYPLNWPQVVGPEIAAVSDPALRAACCEPRDAFRDLLRKAKPLL